MFERPQSGERAILVHLSLPSEHEDLLELKELAKSAGTDPVYVVTGNRKSPDPRYFVGTGKLDEIKNALETHEANLVLFNHHPDVPRVSVAAKVIEPSRDRAIDRDAAGRKRVAPFFLGRTRPRHAQMPFTDAGGVIPVLLEQRANGELLACDDGR